MRPPSLVHRSMFAPHRVVLPVLLLVLAALVPAGASNLQAHSQQQVGSAQTLPFRINFTSATGAMIAGYTNDWGEPYSVRSSGESYGWVDPATKAPRSLVGRGVVRGPGSYDSSDKRLVSFVAMQQGSTDLGAWELALPNGSYDVSLGVGDPLAINSVHRINIEGQTAIAGFAPPPRSDPSFQPVSVRLWDQTRATVRVSDGKLTIDASGGSNTKLDYVIVEPSPARPYVSQVTPHTLEIDVLRNSAVTTELHLVDDPQNQATGIDSTTLNSSTVKLSRINEDGSRRQVAATINTSGGGDTIVLQPAQPLDDSAPYVFEVTSGVKDLQGAAFLSFSSVFRTGSSGGTNDSNIVFDKLALAPGNGLQATTVTIGPDGKLYAGTLTGDIVRFPILANGGLGAAEVIPTIRNRYATTPQFVIGLAFRGGDLWVTHNHGALADAPDLSSKISRLRGANYENLQEMVINLPRSAGDHLTNSLAFGPDGALYVPQGSMSAMGAPDDAWGQRAEHLLSGALLRIDVDALRTLPLDVRTPDAGGTYNPYAPGAPLTIWATGIRNAYDLVFHSNGQLYVPANGSAANGNTPGTPATLPPACANRGDGPYTGPAVPELKPVPIAQSDWLFRIAKGGYYGHPNPLRCEWVLNGGNPTAAVDFGEVAQYPVGTQPDRNYRRAAFDFGPHFSANGVIEYRSDANNGALRGKLLVARYSAGDDVILLNPNGPNGDVPQQTGWEVGNPGLTGFNNPLDLVEDTRNGNLYITELGTDGVPASSRITLLKPRTPGSTPVYKRLLPFTQR